MVVRSSRVHGAFAPRSSWRRYVVPKPPIERTAPHHERSPKPPPPQALPPKPGHSRPTASPALAPLTELLALGPAGEIIRLAGDEGQRLKPRVSTALRDTLAKYARTDGVWAPSSTWFITVRA